MTYELRITCFLDILGFKQHITETVDDAGKPIDSKVGSIASAIKDLHSLHDIGRESTDTDKCATQFSDSLVISYRYDTESGVFWTLLDILWTQASLAYNGFLCRGWVTVGHLFHTAEVLFGPALVDAYERESRLARYPRVVVDPTVLTLGKRYVAFYHDAKTEMEHINDLLDTDFDGRRYIDYIKKGAYEFEDGDLLLPTYLSRIVERTKECLHSRDLTTVEKGEWLAGKVDPFVRTLKENINPESDPDIQEAYRSIPLSR